MPSPPAFPSRITEVRWLTPSVRELTLRREDGRPLGHLPGQWVALQVPTPEGPTQAFFSVASAPSEGGTFCLAVALSASDPATQGLTALGPGATLLTQGPGGTMVRVGDDPTPTLFVGAGTGYAPLHAMAVEAFRAGSEVPRAVVLGARSARELLYVDVLARQRAAGAPLAVTATLSRPEAWWTGSVGHVQAHWERALGALEARAGAPARVYVCGPAAMVTAVRARALSLGLGSERVVTER